MKKKRTRTQVRSAKSYLDDESESRMQLCTYSECTIPDDGDIVFLVRPILRDVHVPPAIAWEHLRLKSPPPLHDVLKHVDLLTKSRWTWHHSLVETFQSVFAFLQKHWSDFSNKQQRHLRTLRLIPINGRLVRASQLFFNLKAQVSPLLFEVPRVFGAYDSLLRNLGASDRPSVLRVLNVLNELKDDLGNCPLNPNELRAVVNMLRMMIETRDEEIEQMSKICVPDVNSVLIQRQYVLYVDDLSLAKRVQHFSSLRFASPMLTRNDCESLGIKKLTEVVHEEI